MGRVAKTWISVRGVCSVLTMLAGMAAGNAWAQSGAFRQTGESNQCSPLLWKRPRQGEIRQAGYEQVARKVQPTENGAQRGTPKPAPEMDLFGEAVPAPRGSQPEIVENPAYGGYDGHGGCCHEDYGDECWGECDLDCCDFGCGPQCHWCPVDYLSVFGGVHGFKGPTDYPQPGVFSNGGNFGFHEGINWGIPLDEPWGLGAQIGAQVYHSNLSGAGVAVVGNGPNALTFEDERHQVFVTGGLFHRDTCGLQGGVVFDYLHEEYYAEADFHQLRSELSYVCPNGREIGAMVMVEFDDVTPVTFNGFTSLWEPKEQYLLFFRKTDPKTGGNFRAYGGLTDRGDGIVGADFLIPVNCRLALGGSAVYVVPEQGNSKDINSVVLGDAGFQQEAWSIGINLVWYVGGFRKGCCRCGDGFMPLFNVADNGTFIIDRRPATAQ